MAHRNHFQSATKPPHILDQMHNLIIENQNQYNKKITSIAIDLDDTGNEMLPLLTMLERIEERLNEAAELLKNANEKNNTEQLTRLQNECEAIGDEYNAKLKTNKITLNNLSQNFNQVADLKTTLDCLFDMQHSNIQALTPDDSKKQQEPIFGNHPKLYLGMLAQQETFVTFMHQSSFNDFELLYQRYTGELSKELVNKEKECNDRIKRFNNTYRSQFKMINAPANNASYAQSRLPLLPPPRDNEKDDDVEKKVSSAPFKKI